MNYHVHLLSFIPASDSTKFPFLGVSANMVSTSSCSFPKANAISRVVLWISPPWSCNSWNLETPRRSANKSRVSSGESWATLFATAIVTRLEATRPERSLISTVTVVVLDGGGIKGERRVGRTRLVGRCWTQGISVMLKLRLPVAGMYATRCTHVCAAPTHPASRLRDLQGARCFSPPPQTPTT